MRAPRRAASVLALSLLIAPGAGAQARPASLTQDVHVPTYPGWQLDATLMLPTADGPSPAVLLVAPAEADPAAFDELTTSLAGRGVAVLRMQLSPAEPTDSGDVAAPGDDAYAALQYLRTREDIDGDRVAIVGWGAASDAAARAAASDGAVRSLVLVGPPPGVRHPPGTPLLIVPFEETAAATTTRISVAGAFLAGSLR